MPRELKEVLTTMYEHGIPATCWECIGSCYSCDVAKEGTILLPEGNEGKCRNCFDENRRLNEHIICDAFEFKIDFGDKSKCTKEDILKKLLEFI